MNMKKQDRIKTDNKGENLSNNPFGKLDFSKVQLSEKKTINQEQQAVESVSPAKKQKIYMTLEKGGRAGKMVTLLEGIADLNERKELVKSIQKLLGVGGTIKDEVIEIQGNKREEIKKLLEEKGYRVVLSGG